MILKRILLIWFIANFAVTGLAAVIAGRWYLSWSLPTTALLWVELGLIMIPNLVLSVLSLRVGWFTTTTNLRTELGWQWNGWQSLLVGIIAFVVIYLAGEFLSSVLGPSIPYNSPESGGENSGIQIQTTVDLLRISGLLLGLIIFVVLTVISEETMFRGLIQTQIEKQYGIEAGILLGALLFGLRHLPNDIYYGQIWQASPSMWISRQVQLYTAAVIFGLARHFGKSTYASAITHGLVLLMALFGL